MKKYIVIALAMMLFIFTGCNEMFFGETSGIDIKSTSALNQTSISGFASSITENMDGDATVLLQDTDVLIEESGTYELSGDYTSVTVNVDKNIDEDPVYLILNNANIENIQGTPLHVMEAEHFVLVLQEGTTNTVSQGAITTSDEEFPSSAIYSRADTTITGNGSLELSTLYQDGINSRDDLIIEGGTILVNAIEDGIVGKDLLAIRDATITVKCGNDGLKSSNSEDSTLGNILIANGEFIIDANNDAISAEQTVQIEDGNFMLTSGGGFVEVLNDITRGEGSAGVVQPSSLLEESMKGIKGLHLVLNGGTFNISSYEDAVHADDSLTINGGVYEIISGDDALHAETDLLINDIELRVKNAYEGLEGATVTINGGEMHVAVLDDAINASSDTGFVHITNGTIYLTSQGDGIDSNGDLTIDGGEIVIDVNAVYAGGDSELDVGGEFNISAGTVTDENGNAVQPTATVPGNLPRRVNP